MKRATLLFSMVMMFWGSGVHATRPPPYGGDWPVCDRLEMSFFIIASLRYEDALSLEQVLAELDEDGAETPEEKALFKKMVHRVYELPANLEDLVKDGEEVDAGDLIGDILDECEKQF